MNARIPVYSGPTADPAADAARWEDDQDLTDAKREQAEREAPGIVLKQLLHPKPGHWFDFHICAGAMYSPDEILADAVAEDDNTRDALAELMASPAALKLKECMAKFFVKDRAVDICIAATESDSDTH